MNRRTKQVTAICVAAAVLLALAPTRTYAGDKEWATAGKILTGVITAQVLFGGLPVVVRPRATVVRHRVIRYEPPCRLRSHRHSGCHWRPQRRRHTRVHHRREPRGLTIRIGSHKRREHGRSSDHSARGRTSQRRGRPGPRGRSTSTRARPFAGRSQGRAGTHFSIW